MSWSTRSTELRDNLDVALGIGERLGCRAFNALYGNRVDDSTPEAQDALAGENLAFAGRTAARVGGTVLLEPLSGAPRYPLRTAGDVFGVIGRVAQETRRDQAGPTWTTVDPRASKAHGVDTQAAVPVLAGGLAGNRILDRKSEQMRAREFHPGFRVDLHHKDLGIVTAAARDVGVATPLGSIVAQLMSALRAQGHGALDHTALLLVEQLSGRGAAEPSPGVARR